MVVTFFLYRTFCKVYNLFLAQSNKLATPAEREQVSVHYTRTDRNLQRSAPELTCVALCVAKNNRTGEQGVRAVESPGNRTTYCVELIYRKDRSLSWRHSLSVDSCRR